MLTESRTAGSPFASGDAGKNVASVASKALQFEGRSPAPAQTAVRNSVIRSERPSCLSRSVAVLLGMMALRSQLHAALAILEDRCLSTSAGAIAELLVDPSSSDADPTRKDGPETAQRLQDLLVVDARFLAGKALFRRREYMRCYTFLSPYIPESEVFNPSAAAAAGTETALACRFLGLFGKYMHGEQSRESQKLLTASEDPGITPQLNLLPNRFIPDIVASLQDVVVGTTETAHSEDASAGDEEGNAVAWAFLHYLKGLCLVAAGCSPADIVTAKFRSGAATGIGGGSSALQAEYASKRLQHHLLETLLLPESQRKDHGYRHLLRSVSLFPWLWAAHQALAPFYTILNNKELLHVIAPSLAADTSEGEIDGADDLQPADIAEALSFDRFCRENCHGNVGVAVYRLHVLLESQSSPELCLAWYLELAQHPLFASTNSSYLRQQLASSYYNLRIFDLAEQEFGSILQDDPFRLAQMDTFSNILYVKDARKQLGALAQRVYDIDPMSPESCIVVGNYYSIKHQHEKAAMYFKRALQMDERALSAWTLLGHEFLELKNTSAAITAYRRAVDIQPTEYRAWYGLGQTYELLRKYRYATYYFQRAVSLRPYDGRMWLALGQCFEHQGRLEEAIKAFDRSAHVGQPELAALQRLAKCEEAMGNPDAAAAAYEEWLSKMFADEEAAADMLHDTSVDMAMQMNTSGAGAAGVGLASTSMDDSGVVSVSPSPTNDDRRRMLLGSGQVQRRHLPSRLQGHQSNNVTVAGTIADSTMLSNASNVSYAAVAMDMDLDESDGLGMMGLQQLVRQSGAGVVVVGTGVSELQEDMSMDLSLVGGSGGGGATNATTMSSDSKVRRNQQSGSQAGSSKEPAAAATNSTGITMANLHACGDAFSFLARYYWHRMHQADRAERYAHRLMDCGPLHQTLARQILREVRETSRHRGTRPGARHASDGERQSSVRLMHMPSTVQHRAPIGRPVHVAQVAAAEEEEEDGELFSDAMDISDSSQ